MELTLVCLSKHLNNNNKKKNCGEIIDILVLFFAFFSIEALMGFLSKCGFQSSFAMKTITASGFLCAPLH